jgi:hypothetical protein
LVALVVGWLNADNVDFAMVSVWHQIFLQITELQDKRFVSGVAVLAALLCVVHLGWAGARHTRSFSAPGVSLSLPVKGEVFLQIIGVQDELFVADYVAVLAAIYALCCAFVVFVVGWRNRQRKH